MPRIGIIIPQQILNSLDIYAKTYGYSRSEFVRHAIRQVIKTKADDNDIQILKAFPSESGTSGSYAEGKA